FDSETVSAALYAVKSAREAVSVLLAPTPPRGQRAVTGAQQAVQRPSYASGPDQAKYGRR
ncbi:MAG: hypothetical protein FWE61_10130, partial [Micrococcales bacterium]|nr:hypothetical protein [Micrococcales bacterium]